METAVRSSAFRRKVRNFGEIHCTNFRLIATSGGQRVSNKSANLGCKIRGSRIDEDLQEAKSAASRYECFRLLLDDFL